MFFKTEQDNINVCDNKNCSSYIKSKYELNKMLKTAAKIKRISNNK